MLLFIATAGKAQLSNRIYRTKVLYDTLVANNNRDFLYNNINITNLTNDSISVLITITPPRDWNLTTQKVLTVALPANQNTIVNLRLIAAQSTTSGWETVKIEYRLNQGIETTTDTFRVKVQEFTKFKVRLPMPSMVLGAYQKDVSFPVYVKNTGNIGKNYTLSFYNNLLNLNYKQSIRLEPNQDTTYKILLRLNEAQWSLLRKEEIKVQVSAEGGETINMAQEISKIGYMLKEHSSAYLDMPLQVETGMTLQGRNEAQYYGALHGRLHLKSNEDINFDIRSKTFTQGQFLNNDIYRIEYEGQKWAASAGNIMQLSDFVMDGYGASVARKWGGENNRIGLYSLLQSRTGTSRQVGGFGKVLVKNKVMLTETAVANFDFENQLNSYIIKQDAYSKINEQIEARITTGVGMEQSTRNIPGVPNNQLGSSIGYNFNWNHKRFNISSGAIFNSNSYPGIFKGQRTQTHEARALYKSVFAGGFYEYNLRKQNMYTDTALISNVFNLKTTSYGARVGGGYRNSNITVSAGQQLQQQSDTGSAPIYKYNFINVNTSVMLGRRTYFNLSSYLGKGMMNGNEAATSVRVMSNQGSMQVYFAGLSARYDIGPFFYHEYLKYLQDRLDYSRVVLSPYAELNLFQRSFTMRTQFNYNKSQPTGDESSNILGNMVYHNARRGFDVNLTGIVPINQPGVEPYITASLRVNLHVPFVPVRKYYQLKLVLFKDENTNGKIDDGEGPITEQMLALNNNLFVSDNKGVVIFKNIEKKSYKADFGYTSKIKGWIPQAGTIQSISVTGNRTVYVPYKKSKVLNGKLNVVEDKNSNMTFKPGNIKVTATGNDSLHLSYSTLTNEEGEFSFNLPAGFYTIALSELAFDDNFKPTEFAQQADLVLNDEKTLYFEIKQKKRTINIRKK